MLRVATDPTPPEEDIPGELSTLPASAADDRKPPETPREADVGLVVLALAGVLVLPQRVQGEAIGKHSAR